MLQRQNNSQYIIIMFASKNSHQLITGSYSYCEPQGIQQSSCLIKWRSLFRISYFPPLGAKTYREKNQTNYFNCGLRLKHAKLSSNDWR